MGIRQDTAQKCINNMQQSTINISAFLKCVPSMVVFNCVVEKYVRGNIEYNLCLKFFFYRMTHVHNYSLPNAVICVSLSFIVCMCY